MKKYINSIITNKSVVIVFNDGQTIVPIENPLYAKISVACRNRDNDKIISLVDLASKIKYHTKGKFTVIDGLIYIKDQVLPKALSDRLIAFIDSDISTLPLEKFWENSCKNPNKESIRDLYGFLEHNGIPITEDGCFIAYKSITKDWKDIHTNTFDNRIGAIVKMPREKVDSNRQVTCSSGLHVAAYSYAKQFYNGILVEVKVNPMNVVSVPLDYNGEKMRVCEYEVVRQCDAELKDILYTHDSSAGTTKKEDKEDSKVVVTNKYTLKSASSGRLTIPKVILEKLGTGNSYFVVSRDGSIKTGNKLYSLSVYKPSKDGSIRISPNVLKVITKRSGGGVQYKVKFDRDMLWIE